MPGTIYGRVDCLVAEASNSIFCSQAKFKTIFDFLSSLPGWTRIAWYAGNPGGSIPGSDKRGADYYDGSMPFGHMAFAVFRVRGTTRSWYCLIQFSDSQHMEFATPGAPACLAGETGFSGVGIQMAWAGDKDGHDANPWMGSTNNDGMDKKGPTVWGAPDGGFVRVLPRSNGSDGKYRDFRQNLSNLGVPHHKYAAYVPRRFHMVADDDTFVLLEDFGDRGTTSLTYAGIYLPRPGWKSPHPFALVHQSRGDGLHSISTNLDNRYGTSECTDNRMDGGIAVPEDWNKPGVRSICFDRMEGFAATPRFQPNTVVNDFEEWAISCGVNEPEAALHGWLGFLDPSLLREAFGMNHNAYKEDKSRVYVGNGMPTRMKYSIPWDGHQIPGSNRTREGVSF